MLWMDEDGKHLIRQREGGEHGAHALVQLRDPERLGGSESASSCVGKAKLDRIRSIFVDPTQERTLHGTMQHHHRGWTSWGLKCGIVQILGTPVPTLNSYSN